MSRRMFAGAALVALAAVVDGTDAPARPPSLPLPIEVICAPEPAAAVGASPIVAHVSGNLKATAVYEHIGEQGANAKDNDVLYLGAPSGHGLWRSTDAGASRMLRRMRSCC